MSDNHKKLVKLAASYSLSCDGWVPVKVADWNLFIDSVNELTEENARIREALRQRVEFAYIEGFSDGRNDAELMQKNNAADEFKRSRAFESLEKLLKGDEDE